MKTKTIGVTGLGDIKEVDVPEDFTDEQIATALKAHPEYKEHGSAVRQRSLGFMNSMAKGVPILGNLVNPYEKATGTTYSKDLEKDYPMTAAGARVAGGVASMGPIAGGVAASTAPGLVRNVLAQSGTFGGIGVADKIAEKGQEATPEDLAWAGGTNAIGGAMGPLIGKLLSPSSPRYPTHDEIDKAIAAASKKTGPAPKKVKYDKDDPFGYDTDLKPGFSHFGSLLDDTLAGLDKIPKHTPPPSSVKDALTGTGAGALTGYLSHHITGLDPVTSGLVGGLIGNTIGPSAKSAIGNSAAFNKWFNNAALGRHPSAEAMLNALGPSVVSSVPPPQ